MPIRNLKLNLFIISYSTRADCQIFRCVCGASAIFGDGVKTDFAFWLRRRQHQFADGIEKRFDGLVVAFELAFQFGKLAGQGFIRGEQPAQTHKRTHDGDIDLHGSSAPQHAGQHRHALLGENVWHIPAATASFL